MVFTGAVFLYLFLPLFLLAYFLLPARARLLWILLASWAFYGWWRLDFLALMVAAAAWTWLGGLMLRRRRGSGCMRAVLAAGIALDLAVLGYFKYFHFGVDSLNALLAALGLRPLAAWQVLLPAAISFYLFHSISYLVDVHRGDTPAAGSFPELAAYMTMFPQLLSGPLIRYGDLGPQLRRRAHGLAGFSEGAARFMLGFCKKVLLADLLAPIADAAFGLGAPALVDAWLGALAYTLQIYFDFSGYSDMAIGLGRMLGFRFPENFRAPYLSGSLTEFWRRWHISLSSWLRDYLYIPLGGNRRGPARAMLNVLVVMLLGGLWHGAAWTFLLWGAWHGLFLALERGLRRPAAGPGVPKPRPWAVAATMLVVMAGWVLFRSPTPRSALALFAGLIGLHGPGLSAEMCWQVGGLNLAALVCAGLTVYAGPWLARRFAPAPAPTVPDPAAGEAADGLHLAARLAVIPLFALALLRSAAESFTPFLYFQF
jgi:alginate O-acetyltransferase complex protein AlgI